MSLSDKLMRYVEFDTNGGCWLWSGTSDRSNYGKLCAGHARHIPAHRAAWIEANGETDLLVLHKCDVPLCINPAHLFIGTHADNMRDRNEKGRAKGSPGSPRRLGPQEREQLLAMLQRGDSFRSIAIKLNIWPKSVRYWARKLEASLV